MKNDNCDGFPYILEYICCDLCGRNESKTVYIKKGSVLPIEFNIVQCSNCNLVYTNPRPPVGYTKFIYSDKYYDGNGCDPFFNGKNDAKIKDAEILIEAIKAYFIESGRTQSIPLNLIEAGGGSGLITSASIKSGFKSIMTDLSADAIKKAKNNGINCLLGELDSKELFHLHGQVDVIVANEVVEHVYAPGKFFNDVNRLLRPGGLFIFTTGNFSETVLHGKNWGYMTIPDAHLYYFQKSTMDEYLKISGFSSRVDVYGYYSRNHFALRLMKKMGVKVSVGRPKRWLEKIIYTYIFKLVEKLLFRRRFDWAVK
jgi:SAM-dependent methyltransferase